MAKLSSSQKREVVRMLAERRTNREIITHFKRKYRLVVHDGQLKYYRHSEFWAPVMAEMREAWDKETSSEFLASKRQRLRCLEDVFKESMEPAYSGTDKESGQDKFTFSPGAAVSAVRQAQEEVEGKQVRVTGKDGGPLEFKVVWDTFDGFGNGDDAENSDT